MRDPLQFVKVADGTVFFAVAHDELREVGIDIGVCDQLLIGGGVDVQLFDFLLVDIQVGLQFRRVDVLHDVYFLEL